MSPMDNDNPREPIDRDLLISRVVDDAASADDWQQLRSLAEYDPSVWRELFEAQHAQAELAQAVQQAIAIADGIDAPVEGLGGPSLRFRFRRTASWAGWAVAASVAVIWAAPQLGAPAVPSTGNLAGVLPDIARGGLTASPTTSPIGEFESFPDTSRVGMGALANDRALGGEPFRQASTYSTTRSTTRSSAANTEQLAEMADRVLLEVRPLPDGRVELIYVRRLIEKAVVDEGDLYQVKPDDAGIDRAVPYRQRRPSSGPI